MLERVVCRAREIVRPANPVTVKSLKFRGYSSNYQDSSDGDYDPGYPDAIPDIPDELLGSACFSG